jgi:hypothetical protein
MPVTSSYAGDIRWSEVVPVFVPWQMQMRQMAMPMFQPMGRMPLMMVASGGFPVPEALEPDDLPPAVKASLMRLLEGPPKPAVTSAVMNQTQESMIAPDLPFKANV